MASLYVLEPGSRLEIEYQRVLVTKDDQILVRVPLQKVSQIVLIGRVGATTPALHRLLQHNIPLLFLDYRGRYLGRLMSPTSYKLHLRQTQYSRNSDVPFCLSLVRAIVSGKIHNQLVYLKRLARRTEKIDPGSLKRMEEGKRQAQSAQAIDQLLGIEGWTSKIYFGLYRLAFDPEWDFTKRTRRPPKDPVNAMLSLGYTLMGHAVTAALEIVGLDPYLGFFHTEKYGRPALALDLVEEFRTPIVDSLVLSLANHHILEPDDFKGDPQGNKTWLNEDGFRKYVRQFSQKMESEIKTRELDRAISYQKHLEVQARKLARHLQGQEEAYQPFQIR